MAPKVLGFTIQIQGLDRSVLTAEDLRKAIQEVNKAIRATNDADEYKKLEKQLVDLKARQAEVNRELANQVRQRRAELTQTTQQVGAYRALSNQLNAARARYKDLAAAQAENTQEAKDLLAQVTTLDRRLKDIDASVGQFGRNVGDYENSIRQALPGLNDFFDGLENIKTASTGTGKALASGFLAFAVADILVQGIRQLKEFVDAIDEVSDELSRFEPGAERFTDQVLAIGRTFNKTTEDIAGAALAISKNLGTDFGGALDLIRKGLLAGADANGKFIETLTRMAPLARDNGLNAEQFAIALTKAGQAGLVSRGALQEVITTGKDYNGNIEDLIDNTNDFTQEQTALYEANLELAEAQVRVTNALADSSAEVDVLTARVKAFLTNQAATFLEFFDQLPATLAGVGAALKTAGRNFLGLFSPGQAALGGNIFDAYNEAFKKSIRKIKDDNEVAREAQAAGEKLFENTLAGLNRRKRELEDELEETALGSLRFKELTKEIEGVEKQIKAATPAIKEVKKEAAPAAGSIGFFEAQVKKLNDELAKTPTASAQFGKLSQALDKAQKDLEKAQEAQTRATLEGARKRELAKLLLASDLQKQLAQNLGAVFGGAGSVAPQDNEVQQVASIEQKKTDAILQKVKERNAKLFQEQRAAREREKQEARLALTDAVNEIGNTVFAGLFDLLAIAQQKASEATQRAFDEQIQKQQEAIDFTLAQSERATGVYKRQLEAQAEAQKKALKEQEARKEKAAKEAAKKEKALAVVQSIIATAVSVARALAGPPPFPASIPLAIAAGVQGAAQTAIIAAQPLARGGKVNQPSNAPATANGDSVLAYLRPGEVVLNSRQQAALGGAPTFRSIGVPGFAAGGQVDAPISAPRLPASVGFTSNQDYLALLKGLDEKTDAINARVDRLRAVVVSEEIAQDLADGETIRVRATLK